MILPIDIIDYAEAIRDLARENWAESGLGFELDIDFETYCELQVSGQMFALGAFADHGAMLGYAAVAVGPSLYNKTFIYGQSDTLFVQKPHRCGTLPGRLILAAEEEAKSRGARLMLWQVGIADTGLAAAFERRGCVQIDRAYSRWL